MKLKLCRANYGGEQTIGSLYVIESDKVIFGCFTLELPWRDNEVNVSCIPVGKYICKKINSPNLGKCLSIEDVKGRTYIRIHAGNFNFQIKGCVLVGLGLADINSDGLVDVQSSRKALEKLLSIVPNEIEIEIIDCKEEL